MRTLASVLAAHYLAAFTALGMPVFMPRVLEGLAPGAPDWLSGLLYVLPTVCTALTATAWGRLADRYGRKLSLMRAQAGLVLGFLMAGFAPNLAWFVCALIVQGTCGGSLAAANAYLATQAQGQSLTRALDWTQFSARLAMVTAPALLGLATGLGLAQTLYRYLEQGHYVEALRIQTDALAAATRVDFADPGAAPAHSGSRIVFPAPVVDRVFAAFAADYAGLVVAPVDCGAPVGSASRSAAAIRAAASQSGRSPAAVADFASGKCAAP